MLVSRDSDSDSDSDSDRGRDRGRDRDRDRISMRHQLRLTCREPLPLSNRTLIYSNDDTSHSVSAVTPVSFEDVHLIEREDHVPLGGHIPELDEAADDDFHLTDKEIIALEQGVDAGQDQDFMLSTKLSSHSHMLKFFHRQVHQRPG